MSGTERAGCGGPEVRLPQHHPGPLPRVPRDLLQSGGQAAVPPFPAGHLEHRRAGQGAALRRESRSGSGAVPAGVGQSPARGGPEHPAGAATWLRTSSCCSRASIPGKINITDVDSALNILRYFPDRPCTVIVKHNNPCGVALGDTLARLLPEGLYGRQDRRLRRGHRGQPAAGSGNRGADRRAVLRGGGCAGFRRGGPRHAGSAERTCG